MSTAAVSSSSLYQELQTFYQDRKTDFTQLGQALQAGDLTDAQTAYNALTTLGQSGPFANSEPFHNTQREQDFTAIGQALQSGDLAGAQQAFASLESTFHKQQAAASTSPLPAQSVDNPIIINISIPGAGTSPSPIYANPGVLTPASTVATSPATSTSSTTNVSPAAIVNPGGSAVPEIILNLGSAGGTGGGGPEEVTITLGNNPSGSGEQLTVGVNNGQGGQEQQIAINLNNTANEQIVLNLLNAAASSQSQGNSISVQA